jgi:FkbM family methyltransferase
MLTKIQNKIKSNIRIYRKDIKSKGVYWSVVHRLYKIPTVKKIISPVINIAKPEYLYIQNNKFYIDKWDGAVSQELILSGKWEEYETKLFKENIKSGDVVVDIGAHIGYYTLIAAAIVGKKGRVYAFEPNHKNFQILKKNVEENNYKNIVLINKAVSNRNKKGFLFLNSENTGDHRVFDSKDSRKVETIQTITLDKYFDNKEKEIHMLKMDIQGSEANAFQGGIKIIKKSKNIKIISEFQPALIKMSGMSAKKYLHLLRQVGFKIYNIDIHIDKITKITSDSNLLAAYPDSDLSQTNFTNIFCKK